jgi:hypothetical protein
MSNTNRAFIAHNLPLRLTPEEMDQPAEVIAEFFSGFDLEDCRDILWLALSSTLCLDDEALGNSISRIELLCCFVEIERLIEASFLIYKDFKKRKG